ncbi:MAG: ATP synthase F1 subunit gamma [Pseudomonadota bacterium]
MANLKQLRRRIQGVTNTQQLTRAMKLVAAAKLRRAQEAVEALRPYADTLDQMIQHAALTAGADAHPLLRRREMKKVRVLVLTSDKGLCGTFNANVNRAVEQYLRDKTRHPEDVELLLVGRKGNEYLSRRDAPIRKYYKGILDKVNYHTAATLGDDISQAYVSEDIDGLFIVYNEFRSAMIQTLTWKQLLPMEEVAEEAAERLGNVEHIYEPTRSEVLDRMLPLYVNTQIYRALMDSMASEMGARMTAMDNATNNAADLIERLTLQYNKARQEAITNELMDIVGGAEALNE